MESMKDNSEKKLVTIKDIAEKSGYSIATVHRALNHKGGLSEETRMKILNVANDLNYTNNYIASALSRKSIDIAIVLPNPQGFGKYYFSYMIKGIRNCYEELYSYNINLLECYYDKEESEEEGQIKRLQQLYFEKDHVLQGLIIAPISNSEVLVKTLQAFAREGTKIVFIDDDLPEVNRICCVAPSDEYIGNLGAELMSHMLKKQDGKILLAAGNPAQSAHTLNAKGFISYMKQYRSDIEVIVAEDGRDAQASYQNLKKLLHETDDIVAAYSVRAKNSIPLCRAIQDTGRIDDISIIGSDLFLETEELLESGVLSAVIYKNPYQKGYRAFQILFDAVIKNISPKEELIYVPISIILRSNLRFYKEFI